MSAPLVPAPKLFGLMAQFESPQALLDAIEKVKGEGYKRVDAYTPYPIEEVIEALDLHHSKVPLLVVIGGTTGCLCGWALQTWINVVDYPLNIGGRPFYSWVAWIPVMFECTILFSALTAVIGMLVLNGLPMPYHPVFNVPGFERATQDRFFLCVQANDPKFDAEKTRSLLASLSTLEVSAVEP